MQRDVAAVIHVRLGEIGGSGHCIEDFLGHRASNRSHRSDEAVGSERCHCRMHAPGNRTLQKAAVRMSRHTQGREFVTELVKKTTETCGRRSVGRPHCFGRAESFNDQVDWTVLQMHTAPIGQYTDLWRRSHTWSKGQGLSECCGTSRCPACLTKEASGRTWSM